MVRIDLPNPDDQTDRRRLIPRRKGYQVVRTWIDEIKPIQCDTTFMSEKRCQFYPQIYPKSVTEFDAKRLADIDTNVATRRQGRIGSLAVGALRFGGRSRRFVKTLVQSVLADPDICFQEFGTQTRLARHQR